MKLILLIDLSKAIDCMRYGLLIAKMSAYGLSNDAYGIYQ